MSTNNISNQDSSPNYYSTYLKSVLRQCGDARLTDAEFISTRSDRASEEYESRRRGGMSVFAAQECAMRVLLDGLRVD